MKFLPFLLILFLAGWPLVLPGAKASPGDRPAPAARLTLDFVLNEVRTHNPAILAARRRVLAMREKIPQERAWEDPVVMLDSNVVGELDMSVTFQQALPVSGRNRSRGRMAEAESATAWQEARKAELEAVRDARSAWFRYGTAQGLLDLNTRNEETLRQLADTARSRFEVGGQTQSELLMAESERARNSEARIDLEREVGEARSALNRLMNRPPETALPILAETTGPRAPGDPQTMGALALRHSPEIRMVRGKIAAARAKLQLAHRQWIPDPMAGVRLRRFKEGADMAPSEPMDEVMLQVSFNVPWANGKKYSAGVREAEAELAATQADLQAAETETRTRIRDAVRKAEAFTHHVALYRESIVPLAREALNAARLGFESSKTALADVLMAQRRLSDDEATALKHRLEAQMALADLDAMVGVPSNRSLAKP